MKTKLFITAKKELYLGNDEMGLPVDEETSVTCLGEVDSNDFNDGYGDEVRFNDEVKPNNEEQFVSLFGAENLKTKTPLISNWSKDSRRTFLSRND